MDLPVIPPLHALAQGFEAPVITDLQAIPIRRSSLLRNRFRK
jgi:hypothetical protein